MRTVPGAGRALLGGPGLGRLRRQLGHQFVRPRSDGAVEADLVPDPLPQSDGGSRGRTEETARVADVEEGLVQPEALDQGGEGAEDVVEAFAVGVVQLEPWRQDDQVRAKPTSARHRAWPT